MTEKRKQRSLTDWEREKVKEGADSMHACTAYDPDRCICNGTCHCHWEQEPASRVELDEHGGVKFADEEAAVATRVEQAVKQDYTRKLLTSYFYELARDHVPIGVLNRMLENSWVNCTYSDPHLAAWAEAHVGRLIYRGEAGVIRKGVRTTKPDVNENDQ